jgi:hypothetical protein
MASPQNILFLLLGAAIGAGGILQGLYWKSSRSPAEMTELEGQVRTAAEEIVMLKRENESLRSLAQGGGELSVPRDFIDRTEKDFGLRFLSNPVIHRIAGEELRDRITAAIESRMGPSGIDDRQESYALIGWLRPDDDLLTQLTAVRAVDANGWFDDVTGEGWMLDKADLKNIPDQATLVGLLARILFHQHFPPAPTYPGDDAARAREALHQGTAAGAEARFYVEKARTVGFMPMTENKDFKQLIASLSPFLQGLTNFPITEGKSYSDALYVRGNETLHTAFRSPPQTTRTILSPGATIPTIDWQLPATPEPPVLTESAGQLGLLLWLKSLGDDTASAEIAATWRGDGYLLFPDGESSVAIVWDIELDSSTSADRFQAIAQKITDAIAKQQNHTNRHLSLMRISPTRLRFLNTAEAATLERLKVKIDR